MKIKKFITTIQAHLLMLPLKPMKLLLKLKKELTWLQLMKLLQRKK